MDNTNQLFKLLVIVMALFCLLFVANQLALLSNKEDSTPAPIVPQSEIGQKSVEFTKAPIGFPSEIPIEENAEFVQNFNTNTTDGRFQASRVFKTTKTLEENYKIYDDYLKSRNWDIKSVVDEENYKMIYARRGNIEFQVSMDNNLVYNIKTISISYTEVKNLVK